MQTDILTRLIQVTIMKKYGDDADSFHDQGTRVQESANWHRQNKIGGIYPHRSQPNRSYSKSSYYSTNTYKPKTTKKSTYKPDYSKTYHQSGSRNYNKPSHSTTKRQYRKKPSYNVISVEEANRRFKQNKSTQSSSSKSDFGCCLGIIIFLIIYVGLSELSSYNPMVMFLGFWGAILAGASLMILFDD